MEREHPAFGISPGRESESVKQHQCGKRVRRRGAGYGMLCQMPGKPERFVA